MTDSGFGARARQATKAFVAASQSAGRAAHSAGRAGKAAASGATRTVHKITHASGAGRTGLAQLIELSAASSVSDGFVAVALAGTLFFSASVTQARDRVALALIITMAPFALLAPFIGPMLDRVRSGRRYILIGTVFARGLLCWGMAGAVQHNDTLTLLPAAFGVLVLQKAFGITRSSVTPRLLPEEITLVTANSRCALASLIATSAGVPLAAGVDAIAGGGTAGAAWVLRVGTLLYLAAIVPGMRLPSGVDEPAEAMAPAEERPATARSSQGPGGRHGPPHGQQPSAGDGPPHGQQPSATPWPLPGQATLPGQAPRPGQFRHPGKGPAASTSASGGQARRPPRWRLFPRPVGPVVLEAIRANITLRAYSGFMIFFLAFLLRTVHFGNVRDRLALGAMLAGVAVGGFVGTAVGSALKAKASQLMLYGMLVFTLVVTALCAAYFGLLAAVLVACSAALGQTLVKLAQDSIVQREISSDVRSSTFAASETLHQLSWVAGGLVGLLLSMTNSGVIGLAVAAAGLALSLGSMLLTRRNRILRARAAAVPDPM